MVLQKKINLFKSKRFKDKVYLQKYWVEPPKLLSGNSKRTGGKLLLLEIQVHKSQLFISKDA